MKELKHLFNPLLIGGMEIKNRIIMSPMGTNLCSDDGEVTQSLINYHAARAEGGVGLIITEDVTIGPKYSMNTLKLNDDRFIPGWKNLSSKVHEFGTKIAPQLIHPSFNARPSLKGTQPVSASPVQSRATRQISRELTIDEIGEFIEQFALMAGRAQEAGCDAVMLHCAHNHHLLGSFLSALHNKRTDEYGGSILKRLKLTLEVIQSIRSKVGPDFPILIRISGAEFETGGRTVEETQYIAPLLVEAGVNAIQISAGTLNLPWISTPPMGTPLAPNASYAEKVKRVVDVPIICGTRITNPFIAEDILATGKANAVAMARTLLIDPAFPQKAAEGLWEDIRPCIGDLHCLASVIADRQICCSFNPSVGREAETAIEQTQNPKSVVVIGGGPGGMGAAQVAALRGHCVTLLEKASKLGGQLLIASFPPMKQEIVHQVQYLARQIYKAGVTVKLNQEVSAETVKALKPDIVILATGGLPSIPASFSVAKNKNVITAWNVLQGSVSVGPKVVVIGGGQVGCEVADFIAHPVNDLNPRGNSVTLLEMMDSVALDDKSSNRSMLIQRLLAKGVRIITSAKVTDIQDNTIKYQVDGREEVIQNIDSTVVSVGTRSNNELKEELDETQYELHIIGDALKPRKVVDAIWEGSEIARKI